MSTDIFDKDLIKIPLKISVRKTIQSLTPLLEDGIVEKEVWGVKCLYEENTSLCQDIHT